MLTVLQHWKLKHPKPLHVPMTVMSYMRVEHHSWCRNYTQNEKQLVNWVRSLSRKGHPFGKQHVELAQSLSGSKKRLERTQLAHLRAAFVKEFGSAQNVLKAVQQPVKRRRRS